MWCSAANVVCRAAMMHGSALLLIASMFVTYTALFAWRANLDLNNHLFYGVVSIHTHTAFVHVIFMGNTLYVTCFVIIRRCSVSAAHSPGPPAADCPHTRRLAHCRTFSIRVSQHYLVMQ